MIKTILNVKTDKDVKERAQQTAKELGLPLSTVVNAFLKQFIRDKEITFSTRKIIPSYLESVVEEIEKDIKINKNSIVPITAIKKIRQYLASLKQPN